MLWNAEDQGAGQPRSAAGLNKLRGTAEPHHAHEHATDDQANQRLQQEDREPGPCRGHPLHALQFRQDSSDIARHACNGSGSNRSCVELGGNRGFDRFKLTHYPRSPLLSGNAKSCYFFFNPEVLWLFPEEDACLIVVAPC